MTGGTHFFARQPAAAGRSVILLVVDTLRRDHLSLHGYGRPTTPVLEDWARGGLVFEDATANSSWTLPSHASMFTGLFPRSHGAHGYRGEVRWGNAYPLGEENVTAAELAHHAGIATGAVVANHVYLDRVFGLDQGFDTYWVSKPRRGLELPLVDDLARRLQPYAYGEFDWSYYRAGAVTDRAIEWLERHRERRFFLFLNYMDPHIPNGRPPSEAVPLEDEVPSSEHRYALDGIMAGRELPDGVLRDLVNHYDREIEHLDGELARLFAHLEESGLAERTCVLLTSDHGEYFGERSLIFHSKHLHREVVDVPLVLRGPGIPAGRSAKPVQSVDVFPTVLELLGLEFRAGVQGRSLLGDAEHPIVSEWYASENAGFLDPRYGGRLDRDLVTIRDGPLRLFASVRERDLELYDRASDPAETTNLASERPDRIAALQALLAEWLKTVPPAEALQRRREEYDPRDVELIEELGYAGR